MFYFDKIKQKNIKYKKVDYASFANGINVDYDEKLLPVRYATSTYNFCYRNGALRTGLGVKDLEMCYDANNKANKKKFVLPLGVSALATYVFIRDDNTLGQYLDMLVIYATDGKLYGFFMYGNSDSFVVLDTNFTSIPLAVNYKINGVDSIIFATPNEGLYVWDGNTTIRHIEDAPNITSMCMHYERMFATVKEDNKSIYFSDDLDPTNWSQSLNEGGFVSLIDERGESNKIISFNDSLYIFRDYGIDRMIAYADQTEFQINPLFTSSTKIYPNTVKLCGDRIMFLANDGIYYFTGLSTTKYDLNINTLFDNDSNDKAIATYYNGKYYLACRLTFDNDVVGCENDEYVNNVLLELDVRTGELSILRGYDIINLQTINSRIESKLVITIKDKTNYLLGEVGNTGDVFGVPTHKVWRSPKTDFNEPLRDKLIKCITLHTDNSIVVCVRADDKVKYYKLQGFNGISTIHPNIKGKEIAIDFICNTNWCNVSNPQVIIGVL